MLGASAQCHIRCGAPSDAPALCDVFRSTWSQTYLGIIPHFYLQSMIARRGVEWWSSSIKSGGVLVLQVADHVVGYATHGAARVCGKFEGEIYELYVAPTHQGVGFGERLFEACRYQLDTRQLSGLIVWALADNDVAMDFYWRRGGRPAGTGYERFGGRKLRKVAFAWD